MTLHVRSLVLAAAVLSAASYGCSFSYSSKSISDSVSASGQSFSDSSASSSPSSDSSAARDARYQEDVRDFAAAYVRGGGDLAGFQRGLGEVARRHGVSDWEGLAATYAGVGEGLRQGQASEQQVEAIGAGLAAGNAAKQREIRRGYDGRAA